jgi:hypothetical protein
MTELKKPIDTWLEFERFKNNILNDLEFCKSIISSSAVILEIRSVTVKISQTQNFNQNG